MPLNVGFAALHVWLPDYIFRISGPAFHILAILTGNCLCTYTSQACQRIISVNINSFDPFHNSLYIAPETGLRCIAHKQAWLHFECFRTRFSHSNQTKEEFLMLMCFQDSDSELFLEIQKHFIRSIIVCISPESGLLCIAMTQLITFSRS